MVKVVQEWTVVASVLCHRPFSTFTTHFLNCHKSNNTWSSYGCGSPLHSLTLKLVSLNVYWMVITKKQIQIYIWRGAGCPGCWISICCELGFVWGSSRILPLSVWMKSLQAPSVGMMMIVMLLKNIKCCLLSMIFFTHHYHYKFYICHCLPVECCSSQRTVQWSLINHASYILKITPNKRNPPIGGYKLSAYFFTIITDVLRL